MSIGIENYALAKKQAIKYGTIGLKSVETNLTNDGILFTLVDNTTFNVPFTSLDFLLKSQLSSDLNSSATTTGANLNAVKLLNDKISNYIETNKIADNFTTNNSSYVASAKTVYTLHNNITNNYIPNTKKSNSLTSESTDNVATSKAVFDVIDYLEDNLLSKSDLTSDYNEQSTTLALSQKGGNNIKNLIVSAVSGLNYIGTISSNDFKTMTIWKQGNMYKAAEGMEIGTTPIAKNSLIIMKTSNVENGTAVITSSDFDSFINAMDFSHTATEIDTATTMTIDAQFTKLGWVDIDTCTLSCDETTRTVTVGLADSQVSSHLYINGTRLILNEAVSIQFDDITGTHYVIMSEAKSLSLVNTIDYNDYTNMPICFIRWNATTKSINAIFDLRVHNLLMDVPTRSYIYSNGIQWQKGFEISNFSQITADTNDLCRFDISGGQIRQSEKLITYVDTDTPTLPYQNITSPFTSKIYYIDGSEYTNNTATNVPLSMGATYPHYNKSTDGVFALAEATEGKYIIMLIGVSTDIRGGQSAIAVMGQDMYDSYDDCINGAKINSSMMADLETRNFRFLYSIIYHCSSAYANSYNAKAVKYFDIRTYSMIPVAVGIKSEETISMDSIVDKLYPIGHIMMTSNSSNPSEYLGIGTWSAYGAGRVPVGIDSTQTEFNSVGQIGGEKKHTLTVGEMPKHSHSYTKHINTEWCSNAFNTDEICCDETTTTATSSIAGGDLAHNNLQPYIVCYMWIRTA